MSHLNKTEHQADATYTAVEMAVIGDANPQEPQSRSDSRFKCLQIPLDAFGKQWKQNGTVKLVILALGIFVSYVIVGILQETIMRGKYRNEGDEKCEKFKYAACLVFVQFIFSFTFIKALDLIKPEGKDSTHPAYYACAALTNVSAMVASYSALRFVTFPMQVILKSAKPISVMIGGLLFCKRYAIQRYLFVLIIVVGVAMFKYFEIKDDKKKKTEDCATEKSGTKTDSDASNKQLFGIGLLLLSLAMDGILGGIQDKIRDRYSPSSRQFMIAMSAWGTVILLVYVVVTGEIFEVYKFTQRYPIILFHMTLYAMAGVVGQLFIFTMVSSFGSLPCSITTTIRKFFSVLLSILFFGNPSTPLQWLGAVLVFAGLLADAVLGKKHSSSNSNENPEQEEAAENAEKLVENQGEKEKEITKSDSNRPEAQNVV